MQQGGTFFARPAALPTGPIVSRLLFEHGAALAVGLVVVALLAAMALSRRQRGRAAVVVLGAGFALAIATALASALVATDREQLLRGARQLVRSVAQGEPEFARAVLHDTVQVVVRDEPIAGLTKKTLLELIARAPAQSAALLDNQAAVEGPGAGVSQLRIRAAADGVPSLSWWRLAWRKDDAGAWVVTSIEPVLVNGKPPGAWLADAIARAAK